VRDKLVERLRAFEEHSPRYQEDGLLCGLDKTIEHEAADRIEELERALDRAHEWLLDDCHGYRASTLHRDITALLSAAPERQ
jgi:hypothetical protein